METSPQNLLTLIEKDKLLKIIESFTRATDITIDINDTEGFPAVQHSFFYGFCRMIRSTGRGLERCIRSNAEAGFKTAASGRVSFITCHAGVVLMAVPIVVDGGFCGTITCGQMHLSPPGENKLARMLEATRDLGLDREELVRTYKEIQVITMEKCLAASELVQLAINYIIELIYRGKMEEKAAREKLRDMREAKTRAELENALRMAELKNLQAQIKPHFLFNTLNTIRGLLMLDQKDRALDTIYALSGLLRYTLEQHGELVTLQEELQYIRSYLMIQKLRFGERLSFDIEVEDGLQHVSIPFLSLQPIVENACIHGIEPKEGGGRLDIAARRDGNTAVITVTDDGAGIPAGVLAALRAGLDKPVIAESASTGSPGLGLKNVHQRVRLYFGQTFGLSLESRPGRTGVTLKIPVTGL